MYYVFGGDVYYPSGGGRDLVHFTTDLEDAVEAALVFLGDEETRKYKWVDVYGQDDENGLVLEWEG